MNACAAVRNSTSVHRVCAAVELEPTRSNAQEQEEEEPVNMAYGLYVSTTYGRVHKSEYC